jgi:cell division transport system permease protein
MIDRGVKEYESKLTNEYTIVVVSQREIKSSEIKKVIPSITNMHEIETGKFIKKLSKNNISQSDLVYLKSSLPSFYKLNLSKFPTSEQLSKIKTKLLGINGITKVETYKKAFEKLYQFLLLTKGASFIFTIFIFVISILLIVKQMEIWAYEHNNRMYIMGLFGAPYWLKSAPLYKLVIIDSIIATILVAIGFLYLPYVADLAKIHHDMGIELRNFSFFTDTLFLLFVSISISVIAVSITIFKQDR